MVTSAHTRFCPPCQPVPCAPVHHAVHDPSPHLHDGGGDGDDTVRLASHHRYHDHQHPNQTPSQTNPHPTTRRTASVYGRYSKLEQTSSALVSRERQSLSIVLFDFFLPRPSLSTTSSSHATWGLARGPPRRRRVPGGGRPAVSSDGAASRCSVVF